MKQRFSLLLFTLCTLSMNAQVQLRPALLVETRDGKSAQCFLADKPKVTFTGEEVTLSTDKITVTYAFASLSSFHFIDASAGDDQDGLTGSEADVMQCNITGDRLSVRHLKAGELLEVYTLDGKCILSQRADASGVAEAVLDGITEAVVIVKAGGLTYKIRKQ